MSARKVIYNNTDAAVQEAVAGLLYVRGDLRLVAGTNNVIVRSDIEAYRSDHVTVICGGGSGHEPAHAGYIGDGMLSCAVLGNVFASPSMDAVYKAIKACASPRGVLVIVKNYTGDRLNFGMAIEKAKAEGIRAQMVIVGDDCTVVAAGSIAGRRGVAGTLLVQKVAGAMAQQGADLDAVCAAAEVACRAVRTLGIGLTSCSLPGGDKSERLQGPLMEVGIGIHGEPGRSIQDTPPTGLADAMVGVITTALLEDYRLSSGSDRLGRIAVMVNNLGTTTELEMNAFVAALMPQLAAQGGAVERLYVGSFMTALDMHGVSVTLMDLSDDSLLPLLDAPVSAPAWIPSRFAAERPSVGEAAASTNLTDISVTIFPKRLDITAIIRCACVELIKAEPLLTQLDSLCGDGDCGQTVQAAAQGLLDRLQGIVLVQDLHAPCSNTEFANTCTYLAENASATMGGTLGAIMELLLRAMANYYHSCSGDASLGDALEAGVNAVMFYGGAKVGMSTMLDALYPAVEELKSGRSLECAAVAAKAGAESTGSMASLAGRASYVNPDAIKGVHDPGATAVAIAFRAAANHAPCL